MSDIVVDARGMQPPEPFERTMDALDEIEPGKKVLLVLRREPFPLYRALELNGYVWNTTALADGLYDVRLQVRDRPANTEALAGQDERILPGVAVDNPPPDPLSLAPDADPAICHLILRCLAKARDDRPRDGSALLAAIAGLQDRVPT